MALCRKVSDSIRCVCVCNETTHIQALPLLARGYHTTTTALKAGYFKITPKGDFPLTYEQAHPPYRIGVTKGWTSWNASKHLHTHTHLTSPTHPPPPHTHLTSPTTTSTHTHTSHHPPTHHLHTSHHPPTTSTHTHLTSPTHHTATLHGPARGPMSVAIEDKFIRKFITGTWYKMWLSEVVIKRVHNNVTVCGMVCPLPSIKTMHFLLGYSETLLSHLLKCNVRLEIQCVQSKKNLVYKFI